MSHFTVLVPADSQEHLGKVLMPYHEYECTGIEEYLEWVDQTDELNKKYREDAKEFVRLSDGAIKSKYDDEFYWFDDGADEKDPFRRKSFHLPVDAEIVEMTREQAGLETFEEFAESWSGAREIPDKLGRYGRLTNPNAKWDWWQVGGRWTGLLHLRDGATGESGSPGLTTEPNRDDTKADGAVSGDIDWDGILAAQLANKMKAYTTYHECLAEAREITAKGENCQEWDAKWESTWKRAKEVYESDKKNCSRYFRSLGDYVLHSIADSLLGDRGIHSWETFEEAADRFYKPESEYRDMFSGDALTYAFIDLDGNWNQRGEMGWFGMSDESKGTDNYDEAFWQFVRSLPPEQRIYVVDCHI